MDYEEEYFEEIDGIEDNMSEREQLEQTIADAEARLIELNAEEEENIEGKGKTKPIESTVKGTSPTGVFTCTVRGKNARLMSIYNVLKFKKTANNQYKITAEKRGWVYCTINSKSGNIKYVTHFKIRYI